MSEQSPFFGISLSTAVRKLLVRLPRSKQQLAYLSKGSEKYIQKFLINRVLKPSIPGADDTFAPAIEAFNSSFKNYVNVPLINKTKFKTIIFCWHPEDH
jgi:hypothetical protein